MRRNTDSMHGFGDIMPDATVHIRPTNNDIEQLKLQNYDSRDGAQTAIATTTVGICATVDGTVTSAAFIPMTGVSTKFIEATITAYCTAGSPANSGAGYKLFAEVSSAGKDVTSTVTLHPLSGSATMSAWVPGITAGSNYCALTFTGSASHKIIWGYELKTVSIV